MMMSKSSIGGMARPRDFFMRFLSSSIPQRTKDTLKQELEHELDVETTDSAGRELLVR